MKRSEKVRIRIPKAGFGTKLFARLEEQLARDQDDVMEKYKKRGFVTNTEDERALHMFFSPTRVPKGLTRGMVRECIDNYPLRKWCCDEYSRLNGPLSGLSEKGMKETALPDEFLPDRGRMTHMRFCRGMMKFKTWAGMILAVSVKFSSWRALTKAFKGFKV